MNKKKKKSFDIGAKIFYKNPFLDHLKAHDLNSLLFDTFTWFRKRETSFNVILGHVIIPFFHDLTADR